MWVRDEKGNTVYRHDGWNLYYTSEVEYQCKITAFGFPKVKRREYLQLDFNPLENLDKVVEILERKFGVIEGTVKLISIKSKSNF